MLKEARIWLRRRPAVLAVAAIALYFLGDWLLSLALSLLPAAGVTSLLACGLLCGLALAMAAGLGYGWAYGWEGFGHTLAVGCGMFVPQGLLLLMEFQVYSLYADTPWNTGLKMFVKLCQLFTVAFCEETIFRGIIANAFGIRYGWDRKGVWRAVILSGFFFGALHLANLRLGISPVSVAVQSLVAWGAGMYFAAVYYRGGCLWAPILIHLVTDAVSMFASTFLDVATDAEMIGSLTWINLSPLVFILPITMFLLRSSKIQEAVTTLAIHRALDQAPGVAEESQNAPDPAKDEGEAVSQPEADGQAPQLKDDNDLPQE